MLCPICWNLIPQSKKSIFVFYNTKIDIVSNKITPDGGKYLADALKINKTLTTLILCILNKNYYFKGVIK